MTIDRTDTIRYRLGEHILNDLQVAAADMTLPHWGGVVEQYTSEARFGWVYPVELDEIITVIYCPEALSLVTDTLDDSDFIIFMDTLEWMIDKHIVLLDTPIDERVRLIEDELYEINPEVLAFMSHLQFDFLTGAT